MIDGIDLLFVLIGFVVLWILWEAVERYHIWAEWDRDRRKQRRRERIELQNLLAAEEYIRQLRFEFTIRAFSENMKKMQLGIEKTASAIRKFNDALKLLNWGS